MNTFEKIQKFLASGKARCSGCHRYIDSEELSMYPHEGGIFVPNHSMRQWVFSDCPVCEYSTSHVKLAGQMRNLKI